MKDCMWMGQPNSFYYKLLAANFLLRTRENYLMFIESSK